MESEAGEAVDLLRTAHRTVLTRTRRSVFPAFDEPSNHGLFFAVSNALPVGKAAFVARSCRSRTNLAPLAV